MSKILVFPSYCNTLNFHEKNQLNFIDCFSLQKCFPKGPESIPMGTKVKISATKATQRADPGSFMLLKDWEEKKKAAKVEKNENRSQSPTRNTGKPQEQHFRNIPLKVLEVKKDEIRLEWKFKGGNGKCYDLSVWMKNEKTVGIPVRGMMEYWKISEVKNYLTKGDTIRGTIVGSPRNWDCKEIYLKLDEVEEEGPAPLNNNNNEVDDATALREETNDLLKHLEAATPVAPLKEDREITKSNIARSPLSKIPEIGDDQVAPNEDFVSVAVDTIMEANNNVVENPMPIEDQNEVVDDLIDISDEPTNEIVEAPVEENAQESMNQDEPKIDDEIEPQIQDKVEVIQEIQANIEVVEEIQANIEAVKEIQTNIEEVEEIQVEPQILDIEPELVQVPKEPSILIEPEMTEPIVEIPNEIPENPVEVIAPPEEFGDTVNTLRSGQESPKHIFSSLELREYTDRVIQFTLNELRRDDFICTLVSKRFHEQEFQAYK